MPFSMLVLVGFTAVTFGSEFGEVYTSPTGIRYAKKNGFSCRVSTWCSAAAGANDLSLTLGELIDYCYVDPTCSTNAVNWVNADGVNPLDPCIALYGDDCEGTERSYPREKNWATFCTEIMPTFRLNQITGNPAYVWIRLEEGEGNAYGGLFKRFKHECENVDKATCTKDCVGKWIKDEGSCKLAKKAKKIKCKKVKDEGICGALMCTWEDGKCGGKSGLK